MNSYELNVLIMSCSHWWYCYDWMLYTFT